MTHKEFFYVIAIAILFIFCQGVFGQNHNIHVSPNGNDAGDGSVSRPLLTLPAALSKMRQARAKGLVKDSAVIELAVGTYKILRPISLTEKDCDTDSSPLIIKGAGIGKTIITGGVKLPPFKELKSGLWMIDLAEFMPAGGEIGQLFVNDERAVLARTAGYFTGGRAAETAIEEVPDRGATHKGVYGVEFKISKEAIDALKGIGANPKKLKFTDYHAWDMTQRLVWTISRKDTAVYVVGNRQQSWNTLDYSSQYFFEDDRSLLNEPGEYYYSNEERILYYIPRKGETINGTEAIIPSTENIFIFKGSENKHIANIRVENLSMVHTRYTIDWRGKEPRQAAAPTKAAVMVDFADNISFYNCEIAHTGNNGLWFRKSCLDCSLRKCYMQDLGIGGVKIGDIFLPEAEDVLTKRVTIDNNILRGGGRVDPTGVGVLLLHASDCDIIHNEIADFYYTGVSVGWVWGYTDSPSKRNNVSYNHIHHLGWGLLSDMGGVYTLGSSEGTCIDHNIIHDIYSFGYGGWGLYTDEGSSGITMQNNLVYNCKSASYNHHFGKNIIIRNNILVNGMVTQLQASRIEETQSFTFSNNIVCYTVGSLYFNNWGKILSDVHDNMYWNYAGDVSFNGLSLQEWQKETGKDEGSIVGNPMFRDMQNGDFTITNKKAIRKIGFKPFAFDKVGVYGDKDWLMLAEFDSARAIEYSRIVERMYDVEKAQPIVPVQSGLFQLFFRGIRRYFPCLDETEKTAAIVILLFLNSYLICLQYRRQKEC